MIINSKFKWLPLCWWFNNGAYKWHRSTNDRSWDFSEVLRAGSNDNLDAFVAGAVVYFDEAAVFLRTTTLYPSCDLNLFVKKLFVTFEDSAYSYTMSKGHGSDGFWDYVVVAAHFAFCILFDFPSRTFLIRLATATACDWLVFYFTSCPDRPAGIIDDELTTFCLHINSIWL